jgi:DHA1 family multidrug resistance protein-like MFS transporter
MAFLDGIGPLLFSPLSEIPSIGRNPPYVISFAIFVVISICLAVLDNFPAIVMLRFFQGFFGSPCLATGGATIHDIYSPSAAPYGIAIWVACIYCGPAVGPLLGSKAVEKLNWHWPLWQIAIMGGFLLFMMCFLPETLSSNILLRRARRLRKVTGNENLIAQCELTPIKRSTHISQSLIRPIEIAIKDPAIGLVCIYASFIYAIYYSFFEVFPLVYQDIYKMSTISYSLTFLAIVVGCLVAIFIYVFYQSQVTESQEELVSLNLHEKNLIPALPGVVLTPVGLFIFAWTARESIHWVVPTLGIAIHAGTTFGVFQAILTYLPITYPQYVASLLAASDFTRSATAAAIIIVSTYMYDDLGVSKGVTLLGSISILGILGMWLFWRFGARLRARSSFATS